MSIPADWTAAQVAAYTLRAEIRAIEQGHRAWTAGDGFSVVSHDEPTVRYDLVVHTRPGAVLRVTCTCPSGVNRAALPIPCKHAALVARRLEREGLAVWSEGLWHDPRTDVCPSCGAPVRGGLDYDHAPDCPHAHPDDPFAGLDDL